MALSWIERLQTFVGLKPKYATWESIGKRLDAEAKATETPPVEEPKPEPTEFEKVYAKFNPKTDMIVMSATRAGSLSQDERNWLNSLGNRVYYFDDDVLKNMAIVRSL